MERYLTTCKEKTHHYDVKTVNSSSFHYKYTPGTVITTFNLYSSLQSCSTSRLFRIQIQRQYRNRTVSPNITVLV